MCLLAQTARKIRPLDVTGPFDSATGPCRLFLYYIIRESAASIAALWKSCPHPTAENFKGRTACGRRGSPGPDSARPVQPGALSRLSLPALSGFPEHLRTDREGFEPCVNYFAMTGGEILRTHQSHGNPIDFRGFTSILRTFSGRLVLQGQIRLLCCPAGCDAYGGIEFGEISCEPDRADSTWAAPVSIKRNGCSAIPLLENASIAKRIIHVCRSILRQNGKANEVP